MNLYGFLQTVVWRTPANCCFWKRVHEKKRSFIRNFYIKETSENICFYFMKETSENACFYFLIGFLWRLYPDTIFLWCGKRWSPNNKYLLELIKRRSKVQEKNMSYERGLNFGQWKTFSENSKPMRLWLWHVYKFLILLSDKCLREILKTSVSYFKH